MSIIGRTFDAQNVTAKADGGANAARMSDGILWGCGITISPSGLTIAPGELVLCGRIVSIDGNTTIALSPSIAAGYGRVVLSADLSQATGSQLYTSEEYSGTTNFNALTKEDINNTGDLYQVELARFTVTGGAAGSIVSTFKKSSLKVNYGTQLPATGDDGEVFFLLVD